VVFTEWKHPVLGVDAGGSSTRAVVLAADGTVLGYGRAGSGNPTSAGAEAAAAAIAAAARSALDAAGLAPADAGGLVSAMAGAGLRDSAWLAGALADAGLPLPAEIEADLTALYLSGSLAPLGCALIVGTGAIAARVRDRRIEAVADGLGWLVGDAGSGFAIGAAVLRAAAADLDGRGPGTTLTPAVLDALGISASTAPDPSMRSGALAALLHAAYGGRPVELSRLCPLAFPAAASGDPVAVAIVDDAIAAVAQTLRTVLPGPCPVVLGGGVIASQPVLADGVRRALADAGAGADVSVVPDGVVGAAVLALARAGIDVDTTVHERIRTTLSAVRG
jgi:glucosamine kinase